jgi:biopolymer transport protein ExbD
MALFRTASALLAVLVVASPAGAKPALPGGSVSVAAAITPRGVWLGARPSARCFVPRKAGALDAAALQTELQRLRGDSRSSIGLAVVQGVTYQELIAVMDIAVKVGLVDVQLGTVQDFGVVFDDTAAARAAAPAHCPALPKANPMPRASSPSDDRPPARLTRPPSATELARRKILLERPIPLPPSAKPDYANLPVVIATKTEITLQGQHVGDVAGIADGNGVIQPLLTALEQLARASPAVDHRQLIVQADESLDAVVIQRVCASAYAAGYSDPLFAVKQVAR